MPDCLVMHITNKATRRTLFQHCTRISVNTIISEWFIYCSKFHSLALFIYSSKFHYFCTVHIHSSKYHFRTVCILQWMPLFSHCSYISVNTIILELFIYSSEFHYFYTVHVFNVHSHHMYTVCPDTPSMEGENS